MAVDANVIIYARIEEEIGAGKTVHAAIRDGFKKATSAILDGNVTTLIAAAVLYALASGSVRGFAMTLALGIFFPCSAPWLFPDCWSTACTVWD